MKYPSIVFVGTYPPRECGIATFTQDLLNSSIKYLGAGVVCKVAAMNVSPLDKHVYPPVVKWEIDQNNKKQHIDLAKTINSDPLYLGVILEHEYGIYGGPEGENILYFIERCHKPIIVTLHTVLPTPAPKMKEVTEKIILAAHALIVLTENSKLVLEKVYPMAVGKVRVIPHGVHPTTFSTTVGSKKVLKLFGRTILTTFGLLSPGKGIEYVIRSLPPVVKKHPKVLYLVLGKTHPVVHRQDGEVYRLELTKLVNRLHLKRHVKFYDQYLSLPELIKFLKATDIYISTSINPDQAVSGTLSYALGTGRAAVSTEFAQSREIITPEVGRLVPIKDPSSMSLAINDLLTSPAKLKKMHRAAYTLTRPMLWTNVAAQYLKLLNQSVIPPLNFSHLVRMTNNFGLFQFAKLSTPDPAFGYTIDDNSRALVVASFYGKTALSEKYLNFIKTCHQPDGSFVNYLSHPAHLPTSQNTSEDLTDANARTLWALSEYLATKTNPSHLRSVAKDIFLKSWNSIKLDNHLRAKALMIKALLLAQQEFPAVSNQMNQKIDLLVSDLVQAFAHYSTSPDWQWFDTSLKYNNAVIPESLFLVARSCNDTSLLNVATKSLSFLIKTSFKNDYYQPVGNIQWYTRGSEMSLYDQQPEDPASMILALRAAFLATKSEMYKNLASICFSWFLGNNSQQVPVYNFVTGGCYDGLTSSGVNLNQGAESLVSYLLSVMAITNFSLNENSTN
ncbi:MAG: glycosyltransferase [Candidatus Shapirobacteria bacterium]